MNAAMRAALAPVGALCLLAAILACPPAFAEGPQTAEVSLEPVFLVGSGETVPYNDHEPPAPGSTVGLALSWPQGSRPASPRLAPGSLAGQDATAGARVRRLVPGDERAGGRDVIEILIAGLDSVTIPALTLHDAEGRVAGMTSELTLPVGGEPAPPPEEPPAPRPAVDIPLDPWGLAAAAGIVLLAAAAVAAGARAWRRRRRPDEPAVPVDPGPPPEPPDVRALAALEALLAGGLLEKGRLKAFAVELAEIGKDYLGEIAGVPLLERTSLECERELRRAGFPDEYVAWLSGWLERLDLVKFADDRPPASALLDAAESLRAVIRKTRP